MASKRGASGATDDESLSSTGGFILNGQSGVESQEESRPTEKTSNFAGQDSTRNQERYQPEELSFPDFREADIAEEKNQDGSESLPNVQNAGQAPGEEARRGYLSETDLVRVEGEVYNRLGHRIIDPNILGARGLVVDNNNDSADSQASLPQTHISSPVKDRENLSTIHQNNNNVASSSSGNNSTVNPKADLHTSHPQTQASPALPQTQASPALPKTQASPALPQTQASPALPQTQASPALPQTQASPAASRRQSARVAGLNPAQHTQATNTIPVRHSLVNFNIKLTGPPPTTRSNLSKICTIPGHAHEPKHRHTTLCADTACGWQITHRHTHTVTTAIAPAPNPPPASNHTSANINQSLPNMPPIPADTNPEETLAEGHEAQSGVAETGQEPLENIDEDLGELECCEGYNREIHPQNHESIRQATHSDVIIACQNTNEHESHGVCETCLAKTWAHLYATHGHLFRDTCWPLCKTCGDRELSQAGNVAPADLDGCTCFVNVLCYNCRIFERETAQWMNKAEASFRRSEPTLVDEAGAAATAEQIQNGENVFMVSGWKCECGGPIGQDVQVVRCAGCNCVKNGTWSDDAAAQKEREFGNTAAY